MADWSKLVWMALLVNLPNFNFDGCFLCHRLRHASQGSVVNRPTLKGYCCAGNRILSRFLTRLFRSLLPALDNLSHNFSDLVSNHLIDPHQATGCSNLLLEQS